MDWLKELLKKLGIEDSKVDGIVADVNKELPKHFVPKQQYSEVVEARKKAEKDVTDRDKQITELGKTAGLSEELKKQIETLTSENQAAAEKHASEMKDLQLSNAIKSALAGKVHDESLVAGLFEKDKLVIDGDKVVGLDEQLKTLQESKAFLFKSEDGQQQHGFRVGAGGGNGGQAGADQLASIFGNTTQQ